MQEKKSTLGHALRRILFLFLHLAALAVFVIGVGILYINPNFKQGNFGLDARKFEESNRFVSKFEEDTATIFDYVFLKRMFESEGIFDEKKPIFVIEKGIGLSEEYTIGDVFRYARTYGYYFDSSYNVAVSGVAGIHPVDPKLDGKYPIRWRAYDERPETEEGNAFSMTLSDLIYESMEYIGKYYHARDLTEAKKSNLRYRLAYGENIYTNDENFVYDVLAQYGKYATVRSDNPVVESNLSEVPDNFQYLSDLAAKYLNTEYQVMIAVDTSYPVRDSYDELRESYYHDREWYLHGMEIALAGLVFMALSLIMLLVEYRNANRKANTPGSRYVLPIETIYLSYFFLILLLMYIYRITGRGFLRIFLPNSLIGYADNAVHALMVYLCILAGLCATMRQIGEKTLYENSLFRRIKDGYGFFPKRISYAAGLRQSFWLFVGIHVALISGIVYLFLERHSLLDHLFALGLMAVLGILDGVLFYRLNINCAQRETIENALHRMSDGDTRIHLDEASFIGREAEMVKNLNNIGHGLGKAISEQVKSERMKADLITNVSHDIKTPLTSIINYVDLMKREKIEDPKILEYLEVLDKKSQHLKNLTEDLVEASKASSGNLSLDISDIDFVDMIKQTNGEFEEKYEARELVILSGLPKEHLVIRADGRRLWRVLENLYNNAFKYAAYGSRVYVEMEREGDRAAFTLKNISENPLNISPDELAERFVRGDVSRTTEGSGLGLSIARSLTELQGGSFKIEIDGDLFKVKLHFPLSVSAAQVASGGSKEDLI